MNATDTTCALCGGVFSPSEWENRHTMPAGGDLPYAHEACCCDEDGICQFPTLFDDPEPAA